MADVYASGQWYVEAGREDEFIRRWRDYVGWGQSAHAEGFERARLLRDEEDDSHFVSFLEWDDEPARDAWRNDPELPQRLAQLEAICREAHTAGYEEASRLG